MAMRLKKVTKKPKPYNFNSKPVKPWLLMWLIRILVKIMLIGRKTKITYVNDKKPKGPALVLSTHCAFNDFYMLFSSVKSWNMNYVMTIDGAYDFSPFLVKLIGAIIKRKFSTDLKLMKNLKYAVNDLKSTVVIYPEARYSLDGTTSYLPDALGKLAKFLKVPVYTINLKGCYVSDPQWNKYKANKMPLEAVVNEVVSVEELETLTADEINERIKKDFVYDDWAWLKEQGNILKCPTRATNLNAILYQCPNCKAEHKMVGEGTIITCTECGKKYEMGENGVMTALEGETEFSHIPDWFKWQRQNVHNEVFNKTYNFECEVDVFTLPDALGYIPQGKGKLVQNSEGTTLYVNLYGEDKVFTYSGTQLESIHIEYNYKGEGDFLDFSVPDDSIWVRPIGVKDVITKLSLATEEIRDLAKSKIK